jgi:PKD repeat protein
MGIFDAQINPDGSRIAQDNDFKAYNNFTQNNNGSREFTGNWVNLGPHNLPLGDRGYKGLGRINAVAFHPTDADIIYIGAPQGGCWKSIDGGASWESNTDALPSLGVSSIVVDYNNPDNVYIGTGDRDAGDAAGIGVFKSTDGGLTWNQHNNGMGNVIVGRMVQHPTDYQTMLAATSSGIFKTTDAGENWTVTENGNFKEIVFKPSEPSTLYAAKGASFFKSSDTGENWEVITNGLSGGSRGVIAVSPDNPSVVYFLVTTSDAFKALYRSIDSGESFSEKSNSPNIMSWGCNGGSGGQAWYDLDIACDPNDADVIFAGGVNCFKSSNGGVTWQISSHWWGDCGVPSVHADLHVLEYNPVDGKLYAGNDGGIYWTGNAGTNWNEITDGLAIGQVYKMGQSATIKDMCINGYQDNGTSTYLGDFWQNVGGGDGMDCAVDHEDATYSYSTIYYGDIYRLQNNGNSNHVAGDGVNGMTESGAWVTPFCLSPSDSKIMFVGMKNIWRCDNIKSYNVTWKKISADLGGSNSQNMRVVEPSPASENLVYAARSDNKLFRTDMALDGSPEWINLTSFLPGSASPTDLEAHPTNQDIVYMTSGTQVFKSIDKGYSWEEITANLPSVSMNTIEYYKNSPDGLYVGSNTGIYYRDNTMTDWILFANGLPVASKITEVEVYYQPDSVAGDVIRASTYGRGLWESQPYYYGPTADFSSSETTIPMGCPIDFYDESTGVPHTWTWTFEGAEPATSNLSNPSGLTYDEEGIFKVKLVVSNPEGSDSITKEAYITVSATAVPNVDFIADKNMICIGENINLTDLTKNCPTAWLWEFEPSTVNFIEGTNQNSQNPVVNFSEAGVYTVSLTATNNAGNSTETKTDYIHSGGMSLPYTEDFEGGSLADLSWEIDNPDHDKTWVIGDVLGTEPGSKAAWINLFDYYKLNARDRMISPSLDFSTFDHVGLTFEHAYAQRYSQTDSLIIFISDDCGTSWTRVWGMGPDGSGVFATAEPTADSFSPQSSADWCGEGYGANCFLIDLSEWAGKSDIKIAFESYNKFGNNLYIDNVQISNLVGVGEQYISKYNATIVPNPNNGQFTLQISNLEGSAQVGIFNSLGIKIFSDDVNGDKNTLNKQIDLSNFAKGIYFLRISNGTDNELQKLILE